MKFRKMPRARKWIESRYTFMEKIYASEYDTIHVRRYVNPGNFLITMTHIPVNRKRVLLDTWKDIYWYEKEYDLL